VTKIINSVKTELHLCQQCARERGELDALEGPKFAFSNLLAGLLQSEPAFGIPVGISGGGRRKCETCGLEYTEFMNTGFLGCSDCYSQFAGRLGPLIGKIHGHTRHTGKVPRRTGKAVRARQELESLRKELRMLIEAEEYEKAALVRDRIRAIEKSNQTGLTGGDDGRQA
jgi:protein arginine kinase activator